MMKTTCTAFIFFVLSSVWAVAQASQPAAKAEVTFTYARQSGSASNQFAVWIEDAKGVHVKTIYATKFTAAGGWERRPLSIPKWVKASGLAKMSKVQIDAITGATPRAGALSYRWDGLNQAGAAVPPGEYTIKLEATLRNEAAVVYSAVIRIGDGNAGGNPVEAEVKIAYEGPNIAERGMISNVKVVYGP
jgi:hypothetical protein